jgi:hypothetical protein
MTAGTGTREFRNLDLGPRLGRVAGRVLSFLPLAAPVIALSLASTVHPGTGYAGLYTEPAFSGQTAQHPEVGYFDPNRLEQQLAAKIDQWQALRGVSVTSGGCELTSMRSASCSFFGSDGTTVTITAYISSDGSRFWTPASNSP